MNSDFSIAVHALVFLDHADATFSSEELAKNICTNPARIRKVLGALGRAGLVLTRKGYKGGYHIASLAKTATLQDVAKALGTRFVKSGWKSGDRDMDCLVASGMADIMERIYDDLNDTCMARLSNTTIGDIEDTIFQEDRKSGVSKIG